MKQIRSSGHEIITLAENLVRVERESIEALLSDYQILFGIFFLTTLMMAGVIVCFLQVKLLRPLQTIEHATQVVAQGEFRPILGSHSRDEIGSLMQAFNRMVAQLQENRRQMIQTEKLSALGTLTSGVAHELNNPLSNISTSCQILAEEMQESAEPYHRELLNSVEEQVVKARDIVRALLEFSREREFQLKPVDLRACDDTIKLIKGDIPSHVEYG